MLTILDKRMPPNPLSLFARIMFALRLRYIEAATCAMPHGAGWYVFAVEDETPRQLSETEESDS